MSAPVMDPQAITVPQAITSPPPPHPGPHTYGPCQKLPWGNATGRRCTVPGCTRTIPC